MDQAIKTYVSLLFTFLSVFMLVSVLTFGIVSNNARSVLYTVIDYLEINGLDEEVIDSYAAHTKTSIEIIPVDNSGIYSAPGKQRYVVKVSFKHIISWINFSPEITYTGVTRVIIA